MQDPRSMFRLEPEGRDLLTAQLDGSSPLRGLSMLAVFNGHLDAGNIAWQVRETLLAKLDHQLLASFDADQLIDYRARRPHVTFDGKRFTDYRSPELQLHLLKDVLGNPFLMLSGPEPDYQWERFTSSVLFLVEELDVKLVTLLDALPLPVPHTRPLGVTAHGNREELVAGLSTWAPQARMLSGVSQLMEVRLEEASRDTSGYTIHVPHYLADATYPQAAVAALEYAGAAMERMLPTDELREQGRQIEQELERQTAASEEIGNMVAGLEQNFDANAPEAGEIRSLLLDEDEQVPDAESLGAAVEDYLSSQPRHAAADAEAPRSLMPARPQEPTDDEFGPTDESEEAQDEDDENGGENRDGQHNQE